MELKIILNSFLSNFINKIDRSYLLEQNVFVRNRKLSFKDTVSYILCNEGRTTSIEAFRFFHDKLGYNDISISKQAILKKRGFIDPKLFIDMNTMFIEEIYNSSSELKKFKDYHVMAVDGSIIDIPNTKKSRADFNIKEDTLFEHKTSTIRLSTMTDTLNDFIISSKIENKEMSEIQHALNHLEDAKNKIDIEKVITIYDRGYNSIELILKTEQLNSKYIIRGKSNTFRKQMAKMISNDENITHNIKSSQINHIQDSNLKEYAIKQKEVNIRVVKIKLDNGTEEILFTNLTKKEATPQELKELYHTRWKIETNYDRLKNKLNIENFSGHRRILIEQDLYSTITLFNILITLKKISEPQIQRKTRYNNKNKYKPYQINITQTYGLLKQKIHHLLTSPQQIIEQIIETILKTIIKNPTYTLKNPPTNQERKTTTTQHKFKYNQRRPC